MESPMLRPSDFHPCRKAIAMAILAGICMLHLAGCSSRPKLLPRNEINEPVFHTTHFSGLGIALGPTWVREPGSDGYRNGVYAEPGYYYERNVNRWASFVLWPGFWNLLLSGEQYADSGSLKVRKLHLSVHGGVSGLSYSQRDGWQATGLAQLTGKFLIDRSWFIQSVAGRQSYDLSDIAYGIDFFTADLGWQVSAGNSLHFAYGLSHYDIPDASVGNVGGIEYHDGDIQTRMALRHSFYAGPKHVFGPEAHVSYRNSGFIDGHALGIVVHYRFLFD